MERENERNKVDKESKKGIKKGGNLKRAQEGTHARVDNKIKKERKKERNKIKK